MRMSKVCSLALVGTALLACGGSGETMQPVAVQPAAVQPVSTAASTPSKVVETDVPIAGISADWKAIFNDGDLRFSTPLHIADGLGPLYTQSSCDSCHASGIRGPKAVQKMSVVELDGVTPAIDQSMLAFGHTVHPLTVKLATDENPTPILPPSGQPSVKVTSRIGPPVIGRGYMEAVADSEIERMEAEQALRTDAIHGQINHVAYASEPNEDTSFHTYAKGQMVIGRFGLKARVATLDDFTADAFQGDMGITSPLRPDEFPNPDGVTDDDKPGVDVDFSSVNQRADYVRLLAIPPRTLSDAGARLFDQVQCSVCHAPSLHTRADYPIEQLADIDAPVYTDFLLHRMGSGLADGLPANVDGQADSFKWRTAPLIGLRFHGVNVTYLHDGRAKTIEDAIEQHRGDGSEANGAVDSFDALSDTDRATLLDFVQAL